VEQLLSHSDIVVAGSATMEEHETALHLAAEYGHSSVLKVLLDQEKIDVWALNARKQTALHRAAMCWFPDKSLQCVQYLLENEQVGDTEMLRFAFLRDSENDTALHIACRRNFNRVGG
jgi:ankyrin repeat protein